MYIRAKSYSCAFMYFFEYILIGASITGHWTESQHSSAMYIFDLGSNLCVIRVCGAHDTTRLIFMNNRSLHPLHI